MKKQVIALTTMVLYYASTNSTNYIDLINCFFLDLSRNVQGQTPNAPGKCNCGHRIQKWHTKI